MADQLELDIVIQAIDEASDVFDNLANRISEDFAAVAAQVVEAETEVDRGINSIALTFSQLDQGAGGGGFDQLRGSLGSGASFTDLFGQMLDVIRASQAVPGIVQNNSFSGILDPSTLQSQVIPELERAAARGLTSLAGN